MVLNRCWFVWTRLTALLLCACLAIGCNSATDDGKSVSANQFRVAPSENKEVEQGNDTKPITVAPNKALTPQAMPPLADATSNTSNETKPPAGEKNPPLAAADNPTGDNPKGSNGEANPGEKAGDTKSGAAKIPAVYAQKLKEMDSLALNKLKPRGSTQEQQMKYVASAIQTRLQLAEELAADRAAPELVRNEALLARMSCLMMMIDPSQPETRAAFLGSANDLAAVKDAKYSSMGKVQLFSLKVVDIFQLKPDDGKEVVKSIENILQEIGQEEVGFEATARVVQMMQEEGWESDVLTALGVIAKHYEQNENPQIVLQVMSMQVNSLIMQYQSATAEKKAPLHQQILSKLEQMIAKSEQSPQILNLILQVSTFFETDGKATESLAYVTMAKKAYASSPNPKILEAIEKHLESAQKRVGLIGKEFQVQGLLIDGEKFDWSKYKGKVVLIDFWATWCGPCLEEIPNIEQNYAAYHDKGFEVVGISLDDTTAEVKEFLAKQPLPWPVVFSDNPEKVGMSSPMAENCGVNAIPFVILVGKDGKVDGIHMRGKKLSDRLAQIFGPAPDTATPSAEKTETTPAETN